MYFSHPSAVWCQIIQHIRPVVKPAKITSHYNSLLAPSVTLLMLWTVHKHEHRAPGSASHQNHRLFPVFPNFPSVEELLVLCRLWYVIWCSAWLCKCCFRSLMRETSQVFKLLTGWEELKFGTTGKESFQIRPVSAKKTVIWLPFSLGDALSKLSGEMWHKNAILKTDRHCVPRDKRAL